MEVTAFNDILQAISTVGFPIVCCIVLFMQNNNLRDTIAKNTEALIELTNYIKISKTLKEE